MIAALAKIGENVGVTGNSRTAPDLPDRALEGPRRGAALRNALSNFHNLRFGRRNHCPARHEKDHPNYSLG